MSTSVVVVSYRPGDWLAPCLASVSSQAEEVILVDNGSADGLASLIGRAAGVNVIRSSTNRGFSPGANTGIRAARGELVALLNDDATAGPGWLASAAAALADSEIAAVGPKVVLANRYREVILDDEEWHAPGDQRPLGRQIRSVTVDGVERLQAVVGPGLHPLESGPAGRWRWSAGRHPWYVPLPAARDGTEVDGVEILVDGSPAPPGPVVRLINSTGTFLDHRGYSGDIGEAAPDDGRFDRGAECFALSGSAMVARTETWRKVGPFADRFFAYYEDIDWCWRARLAGLRLVYDPGATVEHLRSASSGGEREHWVRVTSERNRTLTMVRNGPRRLVASALWQRWKGGPDGGVRAGIARSLPWALASRAALRRHWVLKPEEVWGKWAGRDTDWQKAPAGAT